MGGGDQVEETAQERALADVSKQMVDRFQQKWAPLQRMNGQRIDAMGAPDSVARLRAKGAVATDAAASFSAAGQQALSKASTDGSIGSSSGKLGLTSMADDQAISSGLNDAQTDVNVDAARIGGLMGVVAQGKGQEAQAAANLGTVAAMSGRTAAADAEASLERHAGNAQLIGQGAGLAYGAYSTQPQKFNGTNDISGVNGGNSLDLWSKFGRGGD